MYLHEFWTSCTEGTRGANFLNSLSCQTDKICRLDENSRMQEIIAFYEHTSCLPILLIFIYLFIYLLPFFYLQNLRLSQIGPQLDAPAQTMMLIFTIQSTTKITIPAPSTTTRYKVLIYR